MAIFEGTAGEDTLVGTADADEIFGFEGDDILEGGAGNDLLDGMEGADILDGGDGDDLLALGAGDDQLFGGDGLDWAMMGAWPAEFDVKRGPGGTFIVTHRNGGYWGTDVLTGIEWLDFGPDYGVALADLAPEGTDGDDVILGGAGIDWLYGHAGDDELRGGAGMNLLDGGDGADVAVYSGSSTEYRIYYSAQGLHVEWAAADGEDSLILGYDLLIGVEEIYFEGDAVTVTPADVPALGTAAADVISGTARNDVLVGEDGNDQLYGLDGDDQLVGGAGSDMLSGGAGDDYLSDDGVGDDTLIGGAGVDRMEGGHGADVYVFFQGDTGTGTQADTIGTIDSGEDVIDLSALDADQATAGDQAFTFIGNAVFSATAGELRYDLEGYGARIQWDTDGDGLADGEIIVWNTPVPLVAPDFVL